MTTGFQFYEGATTESATAPLVTVRKGGILVLTGATVEMLGDGVSHVQLGFDPKTRSIAIRPADGSARGRYLLREQKNGRSRLVDGKRFFAHHGLTMPKARTVEAESVGEDLVGFQLPDGVGDGDEVEATPKAPKRQRAKSAS